MARWELTEVQVEAILNMRLRALRRLEEDRDAQGAGGARPKEASELEALLGSERRQWRAIAKEIAATAAEFGGDTPLGRRRTTIGAAPAAVEIPAAALVEREPVTVLLLAEGLDPRRSRAQRRCRRAEIQGRRRAALRGRGGDHRPACRVRQQRPLLYARRRKLPGGRGQGEPLAADDRPAERARHRRDVPVPARGANCWSPRMTGAASSSTARRHWPRPAPASRC